jgi:hypothetical protein
LNLRNLHQNPYLTRIALDALNPNPLNRPRIPNFDHQIGAEKNKISSKTNRDRATVTESKGRYQRLIVAAIPTLAVVPLVRSILAFGPTSS